MYLVYDVVYSAGFECFPWRYEEVSLNLSVHTALYENKITIALKIDLGDKFSASLKFMLSKFFELTVISCSMCSRILTELSYFFDIVYRFLMLGTRWALAQSESSST